MFWKGLSHLRLYATEYSEMRIFFYQNLLAFEEIKKLQNRKLKIEAENRDSISDYSLKENI